ncbi:aminopeptidase C [Sunxiuqinia elliptica]|uniref:Aminopeptidase n=1 Tax=Sunxiuqinia elliptica TaxID=655355 RepID=A0A4R6GW95_9BACT|nr:C1 family peptidase [Sunxiuqinia elliptica]TDN99025.1 bleomycin hydrolase [Sunxiuqinia elliptica]TDO56465.1 bleomycin hydrolase [Sunxiuqinia elliptica]
MNKLKKYLVLATVAAFSVGMVSAQDETKDGYHFTAIKEIPNTPVKDQHRSGTCWSFSGLGFLEAEMLRKGKSEVDLAEMFIVWHTYDEKASKYVRLHGNLNFSAGGAFHDVTNIIKRYGIVPEEAYTGLNYGETKHVHGEMDRVLKKQVEAVIENPNKKLSPAWRESLRGTLDSYLGEIPETFEYKGQTYTPMSFASDYVGLDMDDYVQISSYTHHPFYSKFIIEVPDNWMWGQVYNVPLEDMEAIVDNSIENGYTVAWAADVSEKGFSTSKKGVAVIPDADKQEMSDAEIARWEELSDKEKNDELYKLEKPGAEKVITQEMRQEAFDNYTTTDDHGMLIVGTAKDQNGSIYYKVKNSWGDYNNYDGFFYASKPYVKYKTMSIMVHKDAIPKSIQKKLNL